MELENILKKLDALNSDDVSTLKSHTQKIKGGENFTLITRAIKANEHIYKRFSPYMKERGIHERNFVFRNRIPADSNAVEHKEFGLEYNQAKVQIYLYVFK